MELNKLFSSLVKAELKGNLTPCLWGEAGIGKSSWVKCLAAELGTRSFTLTCNLLAEKADLTGSRLMPSLTKENEYEQRFFPHATISEACHYAEDHPEEQPILFLDEFNRANEDVVSGVLSLITERKIGNTSLPDNLKIMAAGNDRGNISCLDSASISRFINYSIQPSLETFLAVNPNLNSSIKYVLMNHPELLVCYPKEQDGDDEFVTFTTPRTITSLSDILNSLDLTIVQTLILTEFTDENGKTNNRFKEMVESHVGKTLFSFHLIQHYVSEFNNSLLTQKPVYDPKEPDLYESMKAITSLQDLSEFVLNLSNDERLQLLDYCLFDKVDNTRYIKLLAEMILPDPQDSLLQTIGQNISSDNYFASNVEFLMQENCDLIPYLANFYRPSTFFNA